jgi:hypothetical protein
MCCFRKSARPILKRGRPIARSTCGSPKVHANAANSCWRGHTAVPPQGVMFVFRSDDAAVDVQPLAGGSDECRPE